MHFGFHFKLFLFFLSIILIERQANANEWDEWKENDEKRRSTKIDLCLWLWFHCMNIEHNARKHTANSNDSIIYRILKQNYPIWGTKSIYLPKLFPTYNFQFENVLFVYMLSFCPRANIYLSITIHTIHFISNRMWDRSCLTYVFYIVWKWWKVFEFDEN